MSEQVDCLIVGGGIAGMQAAVQLARMGHSVALVEKEDHLGGHVAHYYSLFPTQQRATDVVQPLRDAVAADPGHIRVHLGHVLADARGDPPHVTARLAAVADPGKTVEVGARTVLIATGFEIYDMGQNVHEYNYANHENIITGSELEKIFLGEYGTGGGEGRCTRPSDGAPPESVSFVLCAGSRDEMNNVWCCEVGCKIALNQALHIKEVLPKCTVTVCLIDIRAHGRFCEEMYRRTRQKGVIFLRGRPSSIDLLDEQWLRMGVYDQVTQKLLEIRADLVVLQPTLVARRGTAELARIFGVPIGSDGFFLAENYFSPVATGRPGVFLAGCCTGARDIPMTLANAGLASVEIADFLRHGPRPPVTTLPVLRGGVAHG